MTISSEHPFVPPARDRSAPRRFRGRLVLPVTLWTAGDAPGTAASPPPRRPAGLTVASMAVADGDPAHVLGLVDPESDLFTAIETGGRAVVTLLTGEDRRLADAFGYVAPAPGGPFASASWLASEWGPLLAEPHTWAGVRLASSHQVGYSMLLDMVIEHLELGPPSPEDRGVKYDASAVASDALLLHRGRYLTFPGR